MKLYDECFAGVARLLRTNPAKRLPHEAAAWIDAGRNQLIFQDDMAYELGGGTLPAISGVALCAGSGAEREAGDGERTENAAQADGAAEAVVPGDEVWLRGPDLPELKANSPYARVALIRVREDALGTGDALYQTIRKIEYTRYHLNPTGYMMRISAANHREVVRVSREALADGLDFARVGRMFVDAYHEHPAVEAVKLIFITDPDFPYAELATILKRSEDITQALDHLLKKVKMDCNACGLKDICAEVEEMCKTV